MYGAAVGTVQGAGTDMCGQGSELSLRAAGNFGAATVISADKPENEFFVTGIDEEGNAEVSTAVHGIVERVKTQDSSVPAGIILIMKLNHITGRVRVADQGFTFTGF
ncbi:hypothetical protein [Enterobacter bugandensis]|uniref:hypothetical protein n=1 Tax=Enterobacter bugandensis TaxID=881260 RepID=UPI002FD6BD45